MAAEAGGTDGSDSGQPGGLGCITGSFKKFIKNPPGKPSQGKNSSAPKIDVTNSFVCDTRSSYNNRDFVWRHDFTKQMVPVRYHVCVGTVYHTGTE